MRKRKVRRDMHVFLGYTSGHPNKSPVASSTIRLLCGDESATWVAS